jgi:hypothetical protein
MFGRGRGAQCCAHQAAACANEQHARSRLAHRAQSQHADPHTAVGHYHVRNAACERVCKAATVTVLHHLEQQVEIGRQAARCDGWR